MLSSSWSNIFSLFATGFILWALIEIFTGIFTKEYNIDVIFINVLVGGILGFIAVIVHNYIKEHYAPRPGIPEWRR